MHSSKNYKKRKKSKTVMNEEIFYKRLKLGLRAARSKTLLIAACSWGIGGGGRWQTVALGGDGEYGRVVLSTRRRYVIYGATYPINNDVVHAVEGAGVRAGEAVARAPLDLLTITFHVAST